MKLYDFLPKTYVLEEVANAIAEGIPLAGNTNQDTCDSLDDCMFEGANYNTNGEFGDKINHCVQIYQVHITNNDEKCGFLDVSVHFATPEFDPIEGSYNRTFSSNIDIEKIQKWIIKQIKKNKFFKNLEEMDN